MRVRYFDEQWAFIQSVNARMNEISEVYRRTPIEAIQTLKRRLENSNIHREELIYRCDGEPDFNDLNFELSVINENLLSRSKELKGWVYKGPKCVNCGTYPEYQIVIRDGDREIATIQYCRGCAMDLKNKTLMHACNQQEDE